MVIEGYNWDDRFLPNLLKAAIEFTLTSFAEIKNSLIWIMHLFDLRNSSGIRFKLTKSKLLTDIRSEIVLQLSVFSFSGNNLDDIN